MSDQLTIPITTSAVEPPAPTMGWGPIPPESRPYATAGAWLYVDGQRVGGVCHYDGRGWTWWAKASGSRRATASSRKAAMAAVEAAQGVGGVRR